MQEEADCFILGNAMAARHRPDYYNFTSWEDMWRDYTVFTIVRNPLDRAGSGYDYVNSRRVRPGLSDTVQLQASHCAPVSCPSALCSVADTLHCFTQIWLLAPRRACLDPNQPPACATVRACQRAACFRGVSPPC